MTISHIPQPPKMYSAQVPPTKYDAFILTLKEHIDIWLEHTLWDVLAPPSADDPDYDPEWYELEMQAFEIARHSHRHMLRAKAAFETVDLNLCVSWLLHAESSSMPGSPFCFSDERWHGVVLEEEHKIVLPPHVTLALSQGRYKWQVHENCVVIESLNGEPDFIYVRHEHETRETGETFYLVVTEVFDEICRFPIRRFPDLLAQAFEAK